MRGEVLTAAETNPGSEKSNSDRGPATEPCDSQPLRKAAVLQPLLAAIYDDHAIESDWQNSSRASERSANLQQLCAKHDWKEEILSVRGIQFLQV